MSTPLAGAAGGGRERVAVLVLLGLLVACGGAASGGGGPVAACTLDGECADDVACTRDRCVASTCVHEPEPLACDDGNGCTRDACHPQQGCLNLQDREGQACDDADPCTVGETCVAGACRGAPAPCDDGDPCTVDGCSPPAGACTHAPAADGLPCDDGDACTTGEACQAGACGGGEEACACRDDGDCAPLDDGDRCNGVLACVAHACVPAPGSVVACDTSADGPCARTVCQKASGQCVSVAVNEGGACPPQEPCATAGACVGGACQPTAWRACDDGDPCSVEACEPASGECTSVPAGEGTACDDGDACTRADACDGAGACLGSDPLPCDDGEACTLDLCKPSTGLCVFAALPDGSACDDLDPCSAPDACLGGACVPGEPVAGCCHGALDCPPQGPCATVSCGEDHTCRVSLAADCCGNGVVEAGEECEPHAGLATGACDAACAFATFDAAPGLAGSVLYADAASVPSSGGIRLALSLDGTGGATASGLYALDLLPDGAPHAAPWFVAAAPAFAPRVVVLPSPEPYGPLPHETTSLTWHDGVRVRSRLIVGVPPLLAEHAYTVHEPYGWGFHEPDLDRPGPGRTFAAGPVNGELYDLEPHVGYALPLAPTDGAAEPPRHPLLLARAAPCGSGLAAYPEKFFVDVLRAEELPRFDATGYAGIEARHPAFVRLGFYDRLLYAVGEDHGPGQRSCRLALEKLEGDSCLGPAEVLWSVEGTASCPFAPALIEGADVATAWVVFPASTAGGPADPPLVLVRVGWDGVVDSPQAVLPERSGITVRHEGVRLGPDRVALVYDVLEAPDGLEVPGTMRVGLSYAVLDEAGATVVPPTPIVPPTLRRVPDFRVLPRAGGGFAVFFVERVLQVGRLLARFVPPPP